MKAPAKKKKVKRNVPTGVAHVKATFNNTIITFTDVNGDVVSWSTSGAKGFKGSRNSTPVAGEEAARRAMDAGMRSVAVLVNGPGAGRESAVRAIASTGMKVTLLKDVTPIPHNGCRPPKRRRV